MFIKNFILLKKSITKILAVILIMVLTFANFIFVGSELFKGVTVYAIDKELQETNEQNVKFGVSFDSQNLSKTSIESEINYNPKMYITISVQNSGYLENVSVEMSNSNFRIKGSDKSTMIIDERIGTNETRTYSLELESKKDEIYNVNLLNMLSQIKLKAEYVNDETQKTPIESIRDINLKWIPSKETSVFINQEVLTNGIYTIDGNQKRVIQVLIKTGLENNSYPVEESNIKVEVPKINNKLPENVNVLARTTDNTNGKGTLNFTKENWNYMQDTLNINIKNPKNTDNEIIWKQSGNDEFVITYIYAKDDSLEFVNSNIVSTVKLYNVEEAYIENENTKINLSQDINNLINIETTAKEEILKGYLYTDQRANYDITYRIEIPYAGIIEDLTIESQNGTFDNGDIANTYFVESYINKNEFLKLFGPEGQVIFKDANTQEEIAIINSGTEDIEGNYIIVYPEKVRNMKIETTKPISEGILSIKNNNTLVVNKQEVNITEYNNLKIGMRITKNNIEKTELVNIALIEPETKIGLEIDKQELQVLAPNEIKWTVVLDSTSQKYKLFKNPVIEIQLPLEIEEVEIKDISLLLEDNLKIKTSDIIVNENGNKVIRIALQGEQTEYSLKSPQNLLINANIKLNHATPTKETRIITTYTNGQETGTTENSITLKNQYGLVSVNNIISEGESVTGINEDVTMKIDTMSLQKSVKCSSVLVNNYEKEITNMQITYITDDEKTRTENIERIERSQTTELGFRKIIPENLEYGVTYKENINIKYTYEGQNLEKNINFTLTTGEGPVVDLEILPLNNNETIYTSQILTYNIKATNKGDIDVENAQLLYEIPEKVSFIEYEEIQGNVLKYAESQDKIKTWDIEKLPVGESTVKQVEIKVSDTVEDTNEISSKGIVKTGEELLTKKVLNQNIKDAKLNLKLTTVTNSNIVLREKDILEYRLEVSNKTEQEINNIILSMTVPENTKYVKGTYSLEENAEENCIYDENKKEVQWGIDKLLPAENKVVILKVQIEELDDLLNNEATINGMAIARVTDTEVYQSNMMRNVIKTPLLNIHQTSENNETIKEGEQIKYKALITNTGKIGTTVNLIDTISEQIDIERLNFYYDENEEEITAYYPKSNSIDYIFYLEEGQSLNVEIQGTVKALPENVEELEIENIAKIKISEDEYIESDKISNVIIKSNKIDESKATTYRIKGTAWLDLNSNGQRDEEEQLLKDIEVGLINSDTGEIIKNESGKDISVITSEEGKYEIDNVIKGNYIVVFKFNTKQYNTTHYQKEGVSLATNSDATMKNIVVNGKAELVGITEKIELINSSKVNIDIGLVTKDRFDLSLKKYISKVTVKNSSGSTVYEYANTDFTKIEIPAKYLSETSLAIEYSIAVTNEGNVSGYVGDIIDYLSKDLVFNTEINQNWYLGDDGYLHNLSISQQEIKAGETLTEKIILTKNLTENSIGIITNSAEIGQSTNIEGIEEYDSIFGNKQDKEDDISTANLLVSIKTGGPVLYTSIILTTLITLSSAIYIIDKKILKFNI